MQFLVVLCVAACFEPTVKSTNKLNLPYGVPNQHCDQQQFLFKCQKTVSV